jgi:ketosteroid isomerase-like protein
VYYDPGMTYDARMRSVVERYFECLDAEDWVGMAELWTENGRLRAVGARPRDGRDAVLEYFRKLFDPWPAHEDRPTRLVVSEADATVLAEVVFTGTRPDGREVVFDAIDVFDFEGDRICRMTNWYDIAYARNALAEPVDALVEQPAAR